jgi:hypothetical protein
MGSRVYNVKCKGFSHININCTIKPLVTWEHKNIGKEEDYNDKLYELNPESFSD